MNYYYSTGYKGCPFALHLQDQLNKMELFLPNERKQCEMIWKPVLDEVERKYLSDVIKPFGHRVSYIVKRLNGSGYYIAIILNNFDLMSLPYFTRNTMYKGMTVGRQYKLKELGL